MAVLTKKNNFDRTTKFLNNLKNKLRIDCADRFAREGLQALIDATPKKTGKTASSWSYEIIRKGNKVTIQYRNSNVNDGANVAVLIQYGHGTGTGGYVKGIDYINPALKPVFSKLAKQAWKEMTEIG